MLTVFWEERLFGIPEECKTSRISGRCFCLENRLNMKKLSELFLSFCFLYLNHCWQDVGTVLQTCFTAICKTLRRAVCNSAKLGLLLLRGSYETPFHIYDFLILQRKAKCRDFQKTLPSLTSCIV